MLQLTQDQERYWRPVEAALRALSRHQERSENDGFVHRVSHRLVQIVLDSAAVQRLAVAARPLIARLSDQQKQAAGQLAEEMGRAGGAGSIELMPMAALAAARA